MVDGEAILGHRRAQGGVFLRVEVEAVAGVQGFAVDEVRGGGASGIDGSGRFRLEEREETEGK